jgi:hypothetical protein
MGAWANQAHHPLWVSQLVPGYQLGIKVLATWHIIWLAWQLEGGSGEAVLPEDTAQRRTLSPIPAVCYCI